MNKFFEQLKNEGQNIRLSQTEKNLMRSRIFGAPMPSPYVSHSFSLSIYFRTVMAALLIFVVVGSGTAYAAEGSLPGEPLYAVKINVNEKVQVALASTASAKVQVHAKLAERRVEEAEALVQKGTLDATVTAALAADFDRHVKVVETSADDLSNEDPAAAEEARTQFDSSIKAHGEILARLGDINASSSVRENSGTIARVVFAVADKRMRSGTPEATSSFALATADRKVATFAAPSVEPDSTDPSEPSENAEPVALMRISAPEDATDPVVQDPDPARQKVAAGLQASVGKELSAAQKQYQEQKDALSKEVSARIEARFSSTNTLMSKGSEALGRGDYETAVKNFSAALRTSVELSTYLKAQQKFKNEDLLPQLLRDSDERNRSENDESSTEPAVEEGRALDISVPLPVVGL